jgi:enterochelin esterase-like enzyme
VACPYLPNIYRQPRPAGALDGYAKWLAEVVVPRARSEAPVLGDAAHTGLGGCSLGGYASLEVFLRRPGEYATWGGVQTAIGADAAPAYAERLEAAFAKTGARPLLVETSSADPFRPGNEALASALGRRNIARDLVVLPGQHDQPWLREAGTPWMLFWQDKHL